MLGLTLLPWLTESISESQKMLELKSSLESIYCKKIEDFLIFYEDDQKLYMLLVVKLR